MTTRLLTGASSLAMALTLLSGCAKSPLASTNSFSFTHLTVINVRNGAELSDMTVTVSGNRIVSVAPAHMSTPSGNVVDASGKFLIPGLWDMHAHWADEEYLTSFTVNGVTGIRMMNGVSPQLDWRRRIENGITLGPRMSIAGPFVDGARPNYPGLLSIATTSADDARAAVQTTKAIGFDFVKTYSGLSRDAFFALADECRKENILFAGHVPDSVSAVEFAQAGGVSEEHLRRVDIACADVPDDTPTGSLEADRAYDANKAANVFALFKQLGTWHCPTLVQAEKQLEGDPGLLSDPRMAYLPPSLQAFFHTVMLTPRRPPDEAAIVLDNNRTLVAGMQQAGVGLLAGSDTPTNGVFPGSGLHEELALLVNAGLSPLEALQTATLNPARYLARERELGTVEAGKLADLVLLDANPLADIRNTTKIQSVVQNGKLLRRADLDALLSDLKNKAARGQDSHPWLF
jgi:hypothetical protein